jgi:nucleoside-diphosphate-sugar epimerase
VKVLVTGYTGFIGRHLCDRLLAEGHQVEGLARRGGYRPRQVRNIRAGLLDPHLGRKLRGRWDAVVHAAGHLRTSGPETPADRLRSFETHVEGTRRLLEQCARRGTRRIVYLSTYSVYGGGRPNHRWREDDVPEPRDAYSATKLLGEAICSWFDHEGGPSATLLRLGTVYGPGEHPGRLIPRFMGMAARERPLEVFGGGTSRYDFLFVEDAIEAVLRALRSDAPGVCNIGTGTTTRILDLARQVADTFPERNLRVSRLPGRGGPPVHLAMDVSKAQREWGFKARIPLSQGLERCRAALEGRAA